MIREVERSAMADWLMLPILLVVLVIGVFGFISAVQPPASGCTVLFWDEERKAATVSNLLVVLCGERAAQPMVNTGTLYQ